MHKDSQKDMRYVFNLSKEASIQIWLEFYAYFYKELPLNLQECGMHYPQPSLSMCNAEAHRRTADSWPNKFYTGFNVTENARKLWS